MKLALIQLHSKPTEVKENVDKGVGMYREAVEKEAEQVVFPELWTCGYYLETFDFEAAVQENDWILEKFQGLAKENGTVIVLPLPQKKEEKLYIGLYVIEKDGRIVKEYQKSFLWGREQKYFTHGTRQYEPVETSVGTLGVLICYDIEFPEPARALDNTVFVAGINNVGEGACGHSKVVFPDGAVAAEASEEQEEVLVWDVDYTKIKEVRSRIPYLEEYDSKLAPNA